MSTTNKFQLERRLRQRVPPPNVPTDQEALLQLQSFGAAFGKKVVLCNISFSLSRQGTLVILGPSGTGKSTLLRTLAGLSAANPTFRMWGNTFYRGCALNDESDHPELISQSAKLMMSSVLENLVFNLPERNQLTRPMQRDLALRLLKHADLADLCDKLDTPVVNLPLAMQRHLSILRQIASDPRLLCIDEPTTGLTDEESCKLLNYLRKESARRALLVVLHNQQHARILGGEAILIAGGYVQEQQSIPHIFDAPISSVAREFARSGTCTVASPGAHPEELDESMPPPPPLPKEAIRHSVSAAGPRGFLWLKRGKLAGTPRPGVYYDLEYDLKALRQVGITTLITLTEMPLNDTRLAPYQLKSVWEAIPDMQAPTIEQGMRLCQCIEQLLAQNEVVAVHCRAGLGRTGTILAAHLIWNGHNALNALETVRSIEPRWVQSQAQVDFLEAFAHCLKDSFTSDKGR